MHELNCQNIILSKTDMQEMNCLRKRRKGNFSNQKEIDCLGRMEIEATKRKW